jgi:hypothetical protein
MNARLKARIEDLGREITAKDAQIKVLVDLLGRFAPGNSRKPCAKGRRRP